MKKFLALGLSLSLALTLVACANKAPTNATNGTDSQTAPVTDTQPALDAEAQNVDEGELTLNVPDDYTDLLTIKTDGEDHDTDHSRTILNVAETASIEAGAVMHPGEDWGDGWLFSVVKLDQIGYEAFMSTFHNTEYIFAASADGSAYYVFETPSDVRLMREGDAYTEENLAAWGLLTEWTNTVPEALVADNGLVAFDQKAATDGFIFDGEHVTYLYSQPSTDGTASTALIILGQPTGEGEGKIWAVDSVAYTYAPDQEPEVMRAYPAGMGSDMTAAEYYASVQAKADAGEDVAALTAEGALNEFINSSAWTYGDTDMANFSVIEPMG